MTSSKLPAQALCVTLVMVCFMAGPVNGVSLWSRLKQKLSLDNSALFKREMGGHHPMDMEDDHRYINKQADDHHPMDMHDLHDDEHGIKMGIPNQKCDDGVNGISTDWDPTDHTVLECKPGEFEALQRDSEPERIYSKSPTYLFCYGGLNARWCGNEFRNTSGDHRPLWPKFGEYIYLPPQRWVHSLEHGAIALLYHPCVATSQELKKLKLLVKHCLTKYVTTPYRLMPKHMPFALLAFENALLISNADDLSIVSKFIRKYALKGPETHVLKDGQYKAGKKHGVGKVTNDVTCSDVFLQKIRAIFGC